jgi:hypothetical protein
MGLDMYLHKRTWISPDVRDGMVLQGLERGVDPQQVCYIVEDAGSWRKANAIHRWFVENVQAGVDDCERYQVRRDQLECLLEAVEAVLADTGTAPTILPTQTGFFFGSADYGESYILDLKETQRILTEALADKEAEFEYVSSW